MISHILLVEDDQDDVLFFKDALEEINWQAQLSVCTDGDDAVNFLLRRGAHENAPIPGLIMLDLNLPKRSGLELLEMIIQVKNARMIPLIVMSTAADQEMINECYSMGANSYLKKCKDFTALTESLRTIRQYWSDMAELPQVS